MKHYEFVIIGAGSSGRTAAETLVIEGPGRSILLIDSEDALPYKRTKVSKSVYTGYRLDDFAIHEMIWYNENGIDLIKGESAISISPAAHTLTMDSETLSYSNLLLATGAAPRNPFSNPPPGSSSSLWTAHDGLSIRDNLAGLRKVAIVGVGVLGVESSWQTSQMGLETILVGRAKRPMAKYLDSVTSDFLRTAIRGSGINLKLEQNVSEIKPGAGGKGVLLETENGQIDADYVLTTVGSEPNISIAAEAGIQVIRGIVVDSELRTSAENVWAAGDCAEHPDGVVTGLWHSAEHQGRLAALGMLGSPVDNLNPPYRLKCEVFGGFWFSAGPVNSLDNSLDPAETWESEGVIWRPRFQNGRLTALCGAAVSGLEKSKAKIAQNLVLNGAERNESLRALGAIPT